MHNEWTSVSTYCNALKYQCRRFEFLCCSITAEARTPCSWEQVRFPERWLLLGYQMDKIQKPSISKYNMRSIMTEYFRISFPTSVLMSLQRFLLKCFRQRCTYVTSCDTVYSCRHILTFPTNFLPPF
jgi:hypothetical protein